MPKLNPWPKYSNEEIKAVINVLKSSKVNYLNSDIGQSFEKEFSKYLGVKHSIALANGSVALTAAYKTLGLKNGDEIITTPRTYIATSSTAIEIGLVPKFADVDINSGCITAQTIEPLISKKTKAISVVHLGGWAANMPEIINLANKYNLFVIEDCSQAHGAFFNKKSVGSFSDISTWSFCQDKIISTGGEGGMISTNNDEFYEYIWRYKDHGKNKKKYFEKNDNYEFKFIHDSIGTNLRLTEMQSAIGLIQLKRLNSSRLKREKNAMILFEILKDLKSIRIPLPGELIIHAWYKFYFYLEKKYLKSDWDRNRILYEINNSGYQAFSGSCSEIYKEKCFQNLNFFPEKELKNAKKLGESSVLLLVHPTISIFQMRKYANVVRKIIEKASL